LKITCEITVAAPREAVFAARSNAPFFASCIEGVGDFKEIDATVNSLLLRQNTLFPRNNSLIGCLGNTVASF
jgi:hypothetical protein